MLDLPNDPTKPGKPVIIPRRRPQPVTLAGVLLLGGGLLGLLSSSVLLAAAGGVVDRFRGRVLEFGAGTADASDVAMALRSALLSSGCGALALAALSLALGWGVLRRSEPARVGALVVAVASLGCSLVRTSVTAFGGNVNWAVAAGHGDATQSAAVSQAFSDAMPAWLVGLGGGLTDLQSLGYIAVAALLLAPASRQYFRTRIVR